MWLFILFLIESSLANLQICKFPDFDFDTVFEIRENRVCANRPINSKLPFFQQIRLYHHFWSILDHLLCHETFQ